MHHRYNQCSKASCGQDIFSDELSSGFRCCTFCDVLHFQQRIFGRHSARDKSSRALRVLRWGRVSTEMRRFRRGRRDKRRHLRPSSSRKMLLRGRTTDGLHCQHHRTSRRPVFRSEVMHSSSAQRGNESGEQVPAINEGIAVRILQMCQR